MAFVSIDLEPHEFGVMFDVVEGAIAMEEPFAKLVELELRKEFKKHEVTHDSWADGDHKCEEMFTIQDKKKDIELCVFITPMSADDADELLPELVKHTKYSSEWNAIWNEMKQLGDISVSLCENGNFVEVPDETLERIYNCVKKWTNVVIQAMI